MAPKPIRLVARRAVAEFSIIFVGVMLALFADDFRETREERREAQQSLRIMLADLRSDSLEYATQRATSARWAEASAWLADRWNDPEVPRDSAETALYQFTVRSTLELSAAGFDGLRSANRVRLIDSDSLQTALLQYYQRGQLQYASVYAEIMEIAWALHLEVLAPYVENLAGVDGATWPPREPRVEMRGSWNSLTSDARLHSHVIWLGRVSGAFVSTMASAEELTGRLRSEIEAAISEM